MKATVKEHQQVLFQMLVEIDRICKKYDIQYMLFAGTSLGAVRHHGFIPWDDDLDIMMMRSDYERFLEIAPNELDQQMYFVQKEFSEHWPMTFSKLRKNNTACIERYIPKDSEVHQGVYVDLFPCDHLSDSPVVRKLQFLASKVVIAKSLYRRGYLTNSLLKKVFMLMACCIPEKRLIEFVKMKKCSDSKMVHSFFGASSRFEKSIYSRTWFEGTVDCAFETGYFPVSKNVHELLECLYGDYMTPAPESERGKKKHAELVDLHHSYTEYLGIQKTMKFDEYTRSIR